MRLFRCLSDYKAKADSRGVALAIGNFDGFHIGHQSVIAAMQRKARELDLHSAVMIFEPQPLEFFGRQVPARLFSIRDKLKVFKAFGVEYVFCVDFNADFAAQTDGEFADLLHDAYDVKSVTVGSKFGFGRGGRYSFEDLKNRCVERGMECSAVERVEFDGVRVSSTLIRALIAAGDFKTAQKLIGRKYAISGRVVHGNEIGRKIGFPTANVNLNRRVCPLSGVYAVRVSTEFGVFDGVANVGYRPTVVRVKSMRALLEVNIFDFSGDLYGRAMEVTFEHKIRDEIRFESLEALVKQLEKDKRTAMRLLARGA